MWVAGKIQSLRNRPSAEILILLDMVLLQIYYLDSPKRKNEA